MGGDVSLITGRGRVHKLRETENMDLVQGWFAVIHTNDMSLPSSGLKVLRTAALGGTWYHGTNQ